MTWPMIVISVVLLSTLRFSYLLKNKDEFILHKEILTLFFIIYILCMFQVVTFQDVTNLGNNNFIPFAEILRYNVTGTLFFRNIIGNVIMFIPYGFFALYYGKSTSWKHSFVLILVASLIIECTQLAIGRVFDVDDIILNVFGGMIGYFGYIFLNKIGNIYPKLFKSQLFLDILTSIIFIIFALYVVWR